MNVLLVVLITHRLIYLTCLRRMRAGDMRPRLRLLRQAIDARDYGLSSLPKASSAFEVALDDCICQLIEKGKLKLQRLALLFDIAEKEASSGRALEKHCLLLVLHGALCLCVACGVSFLLEGDLSFRWSLGAGLGFAIYALILALSLRSLPRPFLTHDGDFSLQFVRAWLDDEVHAGPWHDDLYRIMQQEWHDGRDQTQQRLSQLMSYVCHYDSVFEKKLSVHAELLPLGELLLSMVLALCFWSGPLLELCEKLLSTPA